MTDGEVEDPEKIFELISNNSHDNRCFTIGIGRGCDAGLVEGIANLTGGICDFVQEGDSISEKVIPQLQASLHPLITSLEIHIEGEDNDSFEVSPYPIPPVNSNGSSVVFIRKKKQKNSLDENNGILITGSCANEQIEIPMVDIHRLVDVDEDKFGCSSGKNIGKAILPLFAFSILKKIEKFNNVTESDIKKAIELSIESGVLCKFTGYVGMIESQVLNQQEIIISYDNKVMNNFLNIIGSAPLKKRKNKNQQEGKQRAGNKSNLDILVEKIKRAQKLKTEESTNEQNEELEKLKTEESTNEQNGKLVMQSISESEIKIIDDETKKMTSGNEKLKKYDLISLTRYQKAGGYWDDLNAVKNITGINIDKIDEVQLPDKNVENTCIATILAISFMRVSSSEQRNSWSMIEQKALFWLKKVLHNIDIDQILTKIESLIGN